MSTEPPVATQGQETGRGESAADPRMHWLISQVAAKQCVLFVGAGLSLSARDSKGRSGPTGSDLAREIGLHFLGKYNDWSLPLASSYAVANTSRSEVEAFVRDRLEGLQPTPGTLALASIPWKAIYTTNFDLVIERSFERTPSPLQRVRAIYTNRSRLRDLKLDEIPFYKIHGCVTRIDADDGALVLTGEDIARIRVDRKRLFNRLADAMSEYTILYAGYGRLDSDFEEVVGEVADSLGGPSQLPRSFALSPHHESFEASLWESRNISLISQGAEEFFPWLAEQVRVIASKQVERKTSIPALFSAETSVSQDTLNQIRAHFEVVSEELEGGSADFLDFYKGNRPTWGQIRAGCDAEREVANEIVVDLIQHKQSAGPQITLIRAEAGSGKTTLLRRVGADLAATWDLPVLNLRSNSALEFELVDAAARLARDRLYVLVDEAADHARELSEFVTRARRAATNITIIGAARANEWTERTAQFPLPPVTVFEVPHLSEYEIVALLGKLEAFGALGLLAQLSPEQRRQQLRDRAERQILVALREATEGKEFDQIIRDEFDSIPSQEARDAYLYICSVYQSRVALRAGILKRITGIPFEEFGERLLRPAERIIVEDDDKTGTSYRARHPVIAQIIVNDQLPNALDRLTLYQTILEQLDSGYEEDVLVYHRISRSRELVNSLGTYDLKTRFYEAARAVDARDATVAQHWGILAMENSRFSRAEQLIAEARRLAQYDASIQHSAGMLALHQYRASEGSIRSRIYFERAEETFRMLMKRYPSQVAAYDSLARLYQVRADRSADPAERVHWFTNADEVLQLGLRSVSQRSELYAEEGRLRDRMGEYQDAALAFEAALKANPKSHSARQLYARFLLDRGEARKASDLLEEGLRTSGDESRLRHLLAVAMAADGRNSELVAQQFRLSVQSLILHWSAHFDFAVYLYTIGREREAKEIFDELSRLDLDNWEKRRIRALPAFAKNLDLRRVGRVVTLRGWYGFVKIEGHLLDIYVDRRHLLAQLDSRLKEGAELQFRVAFTLSGPTARDVEEVSVLV